jgi:hypothetical protein
MELLFGMNNKAIRGRTITVLLVVMTITTVVGRLSAHTGTPRGIHLGDFVPVSHLFAIAMILLNTCMA